MLPTVAGGDAELLLGPQLQLVYQGYWGLLGMTTGTCFQAPATRILPEETATDILELYGM